jgi:hypothetical protein
MANHLSAIGFPADSEADVMAVVERAGREGHAIPSRSGAYYVLAPGGGPELWVQIRRDKKGQPKFAGFNPHFRGDARMRFGAIAAIRSDDYPMEGTLEGWADPADETPESGVFPLSVEIPDFEISVADIVFLRTLEIQISAFAHLATCFLDANAFVRDGVKMGGVGMATKSFIPLGAFKGEKASTAFFCGEILKAQVKTNPSGGGKYNYVLVDTLGGQIDMVADMSVLIGEPRVGGIAQCQGWLSARLAE